MNENELKDYLDRQELTMQQVLRLLGDMYTVLLSIKRLLETKREEDKL